MASLDGSRLLDALLAVYYQTEWLEQGLMPPKEMGQQLHLQLPELRAAVDQLTSAITPPPANDQELAARDVLADTTVRLGFAQLTRRAFSDDARVGKPEVLEALEQMWRQFAAADYPGARIAFEEFRERLPKLPQERFNEAIVNSIFDPLTRFQIRNFRSRATYHARITDAMAQVEVKRPAAQFRRFLDPRLWSQNVRQVWEAAYLLQTLPSARDDSGVARDIQNKSVDEGVLFEQAAWPSATLVLARFRNLLEVQIHVDEASNPVGFEYQQRECLTSTMLGESFAGGIDVDSGFAEAKNLTPEDPNGWCLLVARKRARFSQPPGFLNAVYNGLAFVWLRLFIEGSVLLGSQF